MKPPPDSLEKWVDEVLHALPQTSAPASLQARVFAEITRRENLPWWKQSWSNWPLAVRWLFLVVSATLCGAAIATGLGYFHLGVSAKFYELIAGPASSVSDLRTISQTVISAASTSLRLIPNGWLYGIAGGLGLIYVTILAVGAAAYRTLWKSA